MGGNRKNNDVKAMRSKGSRKTHLVHEWTLLNWTGLTRWPHSIDHVTYWSLSNLVLGFKNKLPIWCSVWIVHLALQCIGPISVHLCVCLCVCTCKVQCDLPKVLKKYKHPMRWHPVYATFQSITITLVIKCNFKNKSCIFHLNLCFVGVKWHNWLRTKLLTLLII